MAWDSTKSAPGAHSDALVPNYGRLPLLGTAGAVASALQGAADVPVGLTGGRGPGDDQLDDGPLLR